MSTSTNTIRSLTEQLSNQLLALLSTGSTAPSSARPAPRLAETDRGVIQSSIGFVTGQNSKSPGLPEDRLYAALVHARLTAQNPELQKRFESDYHTLVEKFTAKGAASPDFKAADRIMRQLLREKQIDRAEYRASRDFAFGYAQFDGDRTGFGTGAVAISDEMQTSKLLDYIASGRIADASEISTFRAEQAKISRKLWQAKKAEAISAAEQASSSNGSTRSASLSGISGGFLWKPASDSDGNLVILLPTSWVGDVAGVTVLGPDGQPIAEGRFAGNGNGGRDHFRFSKPGSAFPAGAIVEVRMRDGTVRRIEIENPGGRLESK